MITNRVKLKFTALSLLFASVLLAPNASAGAPTEQVRSSVEKVLGILRDQQLKAPARTKERRALLREAIAARFDFTDMARRSLGSQWRRLGAKDQAEFVRVFTDLLERAYIDRIESYTDEKFTYLRENLDRDYAEVYSRIVTGKDEFSLNYKLHLVNGEWKAYDVVIENISLVNNYRSQFNRIITNSSYDDLVQRMKDKQIEMVRDKK